jgi:SnoaL-like domain
MAEELSKEIRVLLDKQAIQEALLRYCRGVDRCDADLMRSVYHEDAQAFGMGAWQFVDHFIPANRDATTFNMHVMANLSIEVDGDRASSESYFLTYVGRDKNGTEVIDVFAGRYVDKWERRDQKWGVVQRDTVQEWSRGDAFGTEHFPIPPSEEGAFVKPMRDKSDVSYRR